MEIIPVIDVKGGVAVAAVRGDRARYRPLESPLAASADPVAVAQGLSALFPFATLYVADLDGIEGRGSDLATQQRLAASWPGRELWIDDGSTGPPAPGAGASASLHGEEAKNVAAPSPLPERSRAPRAGEGAGTDPLIKSERLDPMIKSHVLGSESLTTLDDYHRGRERAGPAAPLSLDFRGDQFIGPPALLGDAALWPDRVIVMTLARVGSNEGPDLERLAAIVARAGARRVYAAGGVRDSRDLIALREAGAAGALVATALHGGSIERDDLARLVDEKRA